MSEQEWKFIDAVWAEEGGVEVCIEGMGKARRIVLRGVNNATATIAPYRCERLVAALSVEKEELK